MKLARVAALASKEWREIVRDRLFFSLAFVVPLLWFVVFGYGLNLDVENVPFAVVDYDRSAMSRDYTHRYIESRYFDHLGHLSAPSQGEGLLADGRIRLILVIPEDFAERLQEGRPVAVQTLIDGTFPFRARTILGYVEAINAAASTELQADYLARELGIPAARARVLLRPLELEVRYLYNQELRSIWSLAPSLMMFTLMLAPPLLTSLTVVREKETGAIYNIYASTARRSEFLLGKLLPNVGISMLNALILWGVATLYFGAPFKGSVGFFLPATFVFVLCTSSIGLLVSLLVRTQAAALLVTVVLSMIPTVLYSGMLVPIASLTPVASVQAHLFPPMYYNRIVQGAFLKGVGWGVLWADVAILLGYAGVLLACCYLLFRKRPRV